LKFVDYKCKKCEEISEIVIRSGNGSEIKCEKCGNKKMVKIFASISLKSNSSDGASSGGSYCGGCAGGNCGTCSS